MHSSSPRACTARVHELLKSAVSSLASKTTLKGTLLKVSIIFPNAFWSFATLRVLRTEHSVENDSIQIILLWWCPIQFYIYLGRLRLLILLVPATACEALPVYRESGVVWVLDWTSAHSLVGLHWCCTFQSSEMGSSRCFPVRYTASKRITEAYLPASEL